VVGDTVYFATGGVRTGGGVFYALDTKTGTQKWRYPATGGLAGHTFTTAPLVQNGQVYVGASDNKLYILNADNGELVQTYQTGGAISASPAIVSDVLMFGSTDDTLYALSTRTPNLPSVWRQAYRTKDNVNSAPVIADGQIFFTSADQFIHSVSAATGVARWQFRLPYNTMPNGVIYADNTLYVPSGPRLYAFLARSGGTRWVQAIANDIAVPPVAQGGVVYVIDRNRQMYALSANRGRPVWEAPITLPYGVATSPTIAGDIIYVPTARNVILALNRADGKVLWEYTLEPSTNRFANVAPITAVIAPITVANGTIYVLSDDGTLTAFRQDAPDSTPPLVDNQYPRPGSTVSGAGTMIVAARLQDPGSGVNRDTIQMSLEGQALDTTYDMDRRLIYYRSEAKSGASSSLPNGRKTVTLTAKDYQGNTVEEKWSFVIDNNLPATSSPAAAPSAPRVRPPRTANPPGMGNQNRPGRGNNRPDRGNRPGRGNNRPGGGGSGRGNGL
jgi:outer membrane protein assembly factor BamB